MTDEEKKAIKVVNKRTERLIEELKIEEEDLIDEPKIAYLITQIEANKILVNLIEKQSKEIEELYQDNLTLMQEINQRWLDKIKAKIEEYEDYGMIEIKAVLQSLF